MRWFGAVRSLLSKAPPASQLGAVVWSASKRTAGRFSPKVSPEVTGFEFAVARPSRLGRLIPAVTTQTDGNTRDGWPWKPVIVIAAGVVVFKSSITNAEPDDEDNRPSTASPSLKSHVVWSSHHTPWQMGMWVRRMCVLFVIFTAGRIIPVTICPRSRGFRS